MRGLICKKIRLVSLLNLVVITFFLVLFPSLSQSTSLFATSDNCAFCHIPDRSTLVDSKGNSLSIFHDWQPTMMGNAFRDPFFRAKLSSELKRNPELAAVIEDKCTTCHTPMSRAEAKSESSAPYSLAKAEASSLAHDGVSCTLCHQIQDIGQGDFESFSGGYKIDNRREIYGPYADVFGNPMLNNTSYMPMYGVQVGKSELCGTCHTLFTPFIDENGQVAGEFPEQTPYLEWLNSVYATGDHVRSCQDCHMPRIDETIRLSRRPPWYDGRQTPFWKHHFVGGNALMLEMMSTHRDKLGVVASLPQFRKTIQRTKEQLKEKAVKMNVSLIEQKNDTIRLTIIVENLTGHKFPTGFPSRRAWLHVKVTDNSNYMLYDSGNVTADGEIAGLDDGFEPHHDLITSSDQVQIYQAIMGDVKNNITYTLLEAAKYLKDNRLVPKGYRHDGAMVQHTATYGRAVTDNNFNRSGDTEGTGADTVIYEIPFEKRNIKYPLRVESQLLYQTVTPRFMADLVQDKTERTRSLDQMYSKMNAVPIVIAQDEKLIDALSP